MSQRLRTTHLRRSQSPLVDLLFKATLCIEMSDPGPPLRRFACWVTAAALLLGCKPHEDQAELLRKVETAAAKENPGATVSAVVGPDGSTVCGFAGFPGGVGNPFLWRRGKFEPIGALWNMSADEQRRVCGPAWVLLIPTPAKI